jgi:hypothetical protein
MPSPFPGMDPYLEDSTVWEEFHHIFITECMYSLSDRLPDNYVAKIGERVELVSRDDEAAAQYVPDIAVAGMARRPESMTGTAGASGDGVAVAPVTVHRNPPPAGHEAGHIDRVAFAVEQVWRRNRRISAQATFVNSASRSCRRDRSPETRAANRAGAAITGWGLLCVHLPRRSAS